MTVMTLSNNTASDIVCESSSITIPASGSVAVSGTPIVQACGDPTIRAAFSAGAIGITINGFALSSSAGAGQLLSDICFSGVVPSV